MKNFLLFAGCTYYPSGGACDYVNSFSSLEEAINYFNENKNGWYDWAHVFDLYEEAIVWQE